MFCISIYRQCTFVSHKKQSDVQQTICISNRHNFSLDFLLSRTPCSFGTKTQWPTDCEELNSISNCPITYLQVTKLLTCNDMYFNKSR